MSNLICRSLCDELVDWRREQPREFVSERFERCQLFRRYTTSSFPIKLFVRQLPRVVETFDFVIEITLQPGQSDTWSNVFPNGVPDDFSCDVFFA